MSQVTRLQGTPQSGSDCALVSMLSSLCRHLWQKPLHERLFLLSSLRQQSSLPGRVPDWTQAQRGPRSLTKCPTHGLGGEN